MSAVIAPELQLEGLSPVKGFMFDLDGTLLLSDRSLGGYEVLPGAMAFGVTTGVMTPEDWARETGKRRPHRVLTEIRELLTSGAIATPGHQLLSAESGRRP